jgi:hypothetical protein
VDDQRCLDCRAAISFLGVPSDATCSACGLRIGTALATAGFQARAGQVDGAGQPRRRAPYQTPLHNPQMTNPSVCLRGRYGSASAIKVHEVTAGGVVIVPGHIPHTFRNPRPNPARADVLFRCG